jgi:hypothetical protein
MTMTKKSDRPLPNEKIDGAADRIEGLGKPSPIKRAERKPSQDMPAAALDPRVHAARMSTSLRSKGRLTLADRVAREGIGAYGKAFADRAKASKTPSKKRGK